MLDTLQDARYRDRVAIFHYGGHADGYGLLLESAAGRIAAADAGGLAAFLGRQRGLKLVFLNGCSTGAQVRGLLEAGVAAVVATSQAIDDAAAVEFAARFYAALGAGAAVQRAFDEAAAAVALGRGEATRDFFRDEPRRARGGCPGTCESREGAELAADWSLPEAAGDPLFGLPPLAARATCRKTRSWSPWPGTPASTPRSSSGGATRSANCTSASPTRARPPDRAAVRPVGRGQVVAARRRVAAPARGRGLRVAVPAPGSSRRACWDLREALGPPGAVGSRRRLAGGGGGAGRPLIVVLDQVEEALTRDADPDRPGELAELVAALARGLRRPDDRPRGKLDPGVPDGVAGGDRAAARRRRCCPGPRCSWSRWTAEGSSRRCGARGG